MKFTTQQLHEGIILKVRWRSNSKNLASENHMNGIVCFGYFLSSCLARKRCANLFTARRSCHSCAFVFRKRCSFKSRL